VPKIINHTGVGTDASRVNGLMRAIEYDQKDIGFLLY
jgi:hypothetical protein